MLLLQLHTFLCLRAGSLPLVMSFKVCCGRKYTCSLYLETKPIMIYLFSEGANRTSIGNSSGASSYVTATSAHITISSNVRIYLIIFLVIFTGMVFGAFCCCIANTSSKCWARLRSNYMLILYAAFTRLPTVTGTWWEKIGRKATLSCSIAAIIITAYGYAIIKLIDKCVYIVYVGYGAGPSQLWWCNEIFVKFCERGRWQVYHVSVSHREPMTIQIWDTVTKSTRNSTILMTYCHFVSAMITNNGFLTN